MRRRPSQLGFTLLELILAMGMISMLAVSLYATLRVAFKARESATSGIAPMRSTNIALDLLGEDLESAMPPTGVLAGAFLGQHLGDTQSSQDTVEFYCVGSGDGIDPPASAGFRKIDVGVGPSPDGRGQLLVRRITNNLLSPQEVQPQEEVLCRNVRSFGIQYYDGTQWTDLIAPTNTAGPRLVTRRRDPKEVVREQKAAQAAGRGETPGGTPTRRRWPWSRGGDQG
jgi:prepilin-type N-terminal cleavage/methylation domain-containing protein